MIKIVVIDPSAPYASGIRADLPDVKIAVDKWHLAGASLSSRDLDIRQVGALRGISGHRRAS